MNNTEIERKWLMDSFPPLDDFICEKVEQGYISMRPAVRISKTENSKKTTYKLTIKGPGTLTRTEVELALTKEQYQSLYTLLPAPPVAKQRKKYRLPGGYILECSLVDEDAPTAFYYAEVEFENEEEAAVFNTPPYLGKEVTEEKGFTMVEYWCKKHNL